MKIHKHIEIVLSTTGGLSSMGPRTSQSIRELLAQTYETVGISILNNLEDLQILVAKQPDLVFIGMKFVPADESVSVWDSPKIWVTEYLEEHNIAFTGSDYLALTLEQDKSLAKQRIVSAGLPTAAYAVIKKNSTESAADVKLTYPLFVKPSNRGGGHGIDANSFVSTPHALQAKAHALSVEINADSIVEEYLAGREFSVAILKDEFAPGGYLLMPLELIAPINKQGVRVLSKDIKTSDSESSMAVPDGALRESITSLAINAFHALGGQDYGRIDIRLDATGAPHFLEANLIPCVQNNYGNFPKACMLNAGIDFKSMIIRIVRLGLTRVHDSTERTPVPEPSFQPIATAL